MKSPTDNNDNHARLQRLWDRAMELERRTLSNVAVTSAGGIRLLEVTPVPNDPGKSTVCIRDSSGNELLKNDTTAGWGLAAPTNAYPRYAASPDLPVVTTSFSERWLFAGFVYSPDIEWAYSHGLDQADEASTSTCAMEYSANLAGAWTTLPGSTNTTAHNVLSGGSPVVSGTWPIPSFQSGTFVWIRLVQKKNTSGLTRAYCTPVYLNAI